MDESTKRLLPWLVAVAFFMETLDGTIISTAAPAMGRPTRPVRDAETRR